MNYFVSKWKRYSEDVMSKRLRHHVCILLNSEDGIYILHLIKTIEGTTPAYPGGCEGSACTPWVWGKNRKISLFSAHFDVIWLFSTPVAWNPAYASAPCKVFLHSKDGMYCILLSKQLRAPCTVINSKDCIFTSKWLRAPCIVINTKNDMYYTPNKKNNMFCALSESYQHL